MAKHALPDLVRPPVWDIEDGHDYLSLRIWDVTLPPLVVVGMNLGKPQTTSSYVGQYIQRATLIAVRFGFGGLTLVNHWTIAESDSTRALAAPVKVGPRADPVLHEVLAAHRGVPVLGAWGDAVAHVDDLCGYRVRLFLDVAAEYDRAILCVGVNGGSGQPRHLSSFRPFDLAESTGGRTGPVTIRVRRPQEGRRAQGSHARAEAVGVPSPSPRLAAR